MGPDRLALRCRMCRRTDQNLCWDLSASSDGLEWIVAKPLFIIAEEIELMRTRNPRGMVAELQLVIPSVKGE